LAIILIAIIALSGAIWLLINPPNSANQNVSQTPTPTPTTSASTIPTLSPTQTSTPTDTNQTPNVKIEDFQWVSGWSPIVGVEETYSFNITLHNLGNNDINGIALNAIMYSNQSKQMQDRVEFYDFAAGNGSLVPFNRVLLAGETRTVRGIFFSSLDTIVGAGNSTIIVTANLGLEKLYTLTYP
jgi:hypothetical protein